ncbi:MAG: ACP S-malonyltransferase [Chloroflexota bacterium]
MSQIILSDENCEGQANHIFRILTYRGYTELLSLELKMLPDVGLPRGVDDRTIWLHCQEHKYLLLTGNRTTTDGHESLEYAIQDLVTPTSLPVLTISNLKRIPRDSEYLIRCAERLADIVMYLEEYHLGTRRLYLT